MQASKSSASDRRQRAVVVVGPGRCGTSTVTRGMAALGIALGDKLKPAMRKNAKGFFEDLDLLDVNYKVHERLGQRRNGSSVAWIEKSQWDAADLAEPHHQAIDVIRQRFAANPVWGFKCGGVLRVQPFWQGVFDELDQDVAYVLAIRNPLSVARSRQKLDPHRGRQEKSDLEWLAQIIPYFPAVLARPFIVVDYDEMMADPAKQLHRMIDRFGLVRDETVDRQIAEFASDFVSGDLHHNRTAESALDDDPHLNPLTRDAYRWLLRLARDQIGPDDASFRAGWKRLEAAWHDMAPALRLIDTLEGELRGRGRNIGALWRAASQHMPTANTLGDLRDRMLGKPARVN